jgi:hypothetical protein
MCLQFGGAKATPYEAHQMLKDKEHLLLFPGGKGEVTTDRSGQKFRLHWREHADYVAMAQVRVSPFLHYHLFRLMPN